MRRAHTEERENQADQRAEVFQENDRQLRLLGTADERDPALLAADVVGFDDRGPEREGLGDDGHKKYRTRCRPAGAPHPAPLRHGEAARLARNSAGHRADNDWV
jgi:hypothetical protein